MLQLASRGVVDLTQAQVGKTHTILDLNTHDEEVEGFLRRLGCYPGERITLLNKSRHLYTVVIKNSRYTLDTELARSISV